MKAPSVSYSFEPLNSSYLPLLRRLLQEIFQLVPLKESFSNSDHGQHGTEKSRRVFSLLCQFP